MVSETGPSKLVMLSHINILSEVRALDSELKIIEKIWSNTGKIVDKRQLKIYSMLYGFIYETNIAVNSSTFGELSSARF